jgi:hypothetical protein
MLSLRSTFLSAAILPLLIAACDGADQTTLPQLVPQFTAGSGTTPTFLGKATHQDGFKVKRDGADWDIKVEAKSGLEVAAQRIVFGVGAHSGWHSHPGPVFIQVVTGEMTFYESTDPSCTPIVRRAGQGFLDVGDHAHIARNQSGAPAENLVVYFAPPGTAQAALRIDEPNPGNCPF